LAGSVSTGAIESLTVTVKLPLALFPAASAAEQVTVVVPIANVLPETGAQVTGTMPSIASSADAVKETTAPAALVASAVWLAGSVSTGAIESLTVTVKLPFATLPAASAAEQVTVVVPIANVLPETGAQLTGTIPSIASRAEALNVTIAPAALVASAV
jgi:sulfopyruvate decarboxylase TPP-binding subunit